MFSKFCPPWVRVCADEYRTARYVWEQEREAFSNGWATEMREFQEISPSPMFREFLRDHAARLREDGAAFIAA